MICKNCGAELQAADTFCGECGVKIESQEKEAVKCSECGKFFNKEFGICPFCGSEISTGKSVDEILPENDETQTYGTQDEEKTFAMCPVCGNRYDADVGLCDICGYSELESEVEHEEDNVLEVKTNKKSCEDVVNCSRHNKCFSANGGNCPFCSYTPEKAILYEKNKETFIGKCDICDREPVLLRKHEINDWMGTRYRNMCEDCITEYENKQEQPKNNESSESSSFFSEHKKGIIIAVIIAIVLLLIIIISANSGYTCSQCGERFHEGKTVFGEYWCNDCFYD